MLRIEKNILSLLECDREALFLGIITSDGRVLLREAAAESCPGHTDWLRLDPDMAARFGFSVVARKGRVVEIYRASALNPSRDWGLLSLELVEELRAVLPVADDLTVYGH